MYAHNWSKIYTWLNWRKFPLCDHQSGSDSTWAMPQGPKGGCGGMRAQQGSFWIWIWIRWAGRRYYNVARRDCRSLLDHPAKNTLLSSLKLDGMLLKPQGIGRIRNRGKFAGRVQKIPLLIFRIVEMQEHWARRITNCISIRFMWFGTNCCPFWLLFLMPEIKIFPPIWTSISPKQEKRLQRSCKRSLWFSKWEIQLPCKREREAVDPTWEMND